MSKQTDDKIEVSTVRATSHPLHETKRRNQRDRMKKSSTVQHQKNPTNKSSSGGSFREMMFLFTTTLTLTLGLILLCAALAQDDESERTKTDNLFARWSTSGDRYARREKNRKTRRDTLKNHGAKEESIADQLLENLYAKLATERDALRYGSSGYGSGQSSERHPPPIQYRRELLYHLSSNTTYSPQNESGTVTDRSSTLPPMPQSQITKNRNIIKAMFTHAYDGYMYNAYPSSELKPISCERGTFHLSRVPALTLIDTLDTLLLMGNYTEFARSVERLRMLHVQRLDGQGFGGLFHVDQNVSLFETNIRVLGGLLASHQLVLDIGPEVQRRFVFEGEDGGVRIGPVVGEAWVDYGEVWEYDDFLLVLARDIGDRLLPAFHTETGIPYGTVNLIYGVPKGETTVSSLAGSGTLSLEFELLSRLSSDPKYGNAAILATRALFLRHHTPTFLYGKHIDIQSGNWKEHLSGIGSNSDSFYEYILKFYILFQKPDFWRMFHVVHGAVWKHVRTDEHWYGDVDMTYVNHGASKRPVFESLAAFWPGLQVLMGELTPAKALLNAIFLIREELGFLPERFSYEKKSVDGGGSAGRHPLRPELLESTYLLHRATKMNNSSSWLWAADFSLHALEHLTKTECGYASVRRVTTRHTRNIGDTYDKYYSKRGVELEDEMPSYFLSETIKYLYLIFDDDNHIHKENDRPWIFTTEAHPIHYEEDIRPADGTEDATWANKTTEKQYNAEIEKLFQEQKHKPKFNFSNFDMANPHGQTHHIASHCPNYHHPSLEWANLLNIKGALNYELNYFTKVGKSQDTDTTSVPQGLCLLRKQQSQVAITTPQQQEQDNLDRFITPTTVETVDDLVFNRFDMGPPLGELEVSMLEEGFYARHISSGEKLEATMVSVNQDEDSYLLVMQESPTFRKRRVILSDWKGNAFSCEIKISKIYKNLGKQLIREIPCSTALFGPTTIAKLVAVRDESEGRGLVLNTVINPVDYLNPMGCTQNTPQQTINTGGIAVVHRGNCAFETKALLAKKNYNSEGMIVINNAKDQLFVMSSGSDLPETPEDVDLPTSVLITKEEGMALKEYLEMAKSDALSGDHYQLEGAITVLPQKRADDINTSVTGVEDLDWPLINTSPGIAQVMAYHGWGIHVEKANKDGNVQDMVRTEGLENDETDDNLTEDISSWKMFIVKHGLGHKYDDDEEVQL